MSSPIGSRSRRRISAAPTKPRCPATQTRLPSRSDKVRPVQGCRPGLRLGHRQLLPGEVGVHHAPYEILERNRGLPAELSIRLRRVRTQLRDIGRS